ncbi:MAG: hypothetical protein DRQ88_05820 [Epsilonproteobacteria bacterium]|nr:MAG: hypothetical protein DRQ89_06945 [Campylobacterota bacterium]RLA66730.1 MAG: hypothetical protein DRQ88_05820 [Campylobacterota bacterium]
MKAFLLFLTIFFGGMFYFLFSETEEPELEDFLVQEKVILKEPQGIKPLLKPAPKRPPMIKRKIAEVVKAKVEAEISLYLVEAINRQKFGGTLTGDNIQGSLNIFEGQIQSINISLNPRSGTPILFEASAIDLNPGGSFIVDDEEGMISGILIDSGKGKYTLRFATGPLAGSALLFEQEKTFAEKQAMEQAQMSQAYALAQRQEVQNMNELPDDSNYQMNARPEVMPMEANEEIEVAAHRPEYSEYDMEERAEDSGYTF